MVNPKLSRVRAVCLIVIPLVAACGGTPAQSAAPATGTASSTATVTPAASATASASSAPPSAAPPTATPTTGLLPTTPTPPSPESSGAKGPDYTGDWGGLRLAGTVKYCGSAKQPYWGADIVSNSGDKGFLAYDIPAGSTEAVEAEVVTPFIVPEFTTLSQGTGQFVAGSPPHFVIVNGEGTWDITLRVGSFCSTG